MSGIEVVGLVLAAIPLIISGLEHYAEGVESIKVIRNATQEFRAVARKLDAENVVFRNTLEILLLECLDVRTQKALLHDVAGAAWTDPEVERALCHRLDSSYQSYIDHIKHVKKTLDQFTLRLEINSIGKVSQRACHVAKEDDARGSALSRQLILGLVVCWIVSDDYS